MRLQATEDVRTRLTFQIAKKLRRTRTGPISVRVRQQTSVRVPCALPKALPVRYRMTRSWPSSWPLGPSCQRPFAPASWRWSRPPRSECIHSCLAWRTGASDNPKPRRSKNRSRGAIEWSCDGSLSPAPRTRYRQIRFPAPLPGIRLPRAAPFYGCQKSNGSISRSERRFLSHRFRIYVEPEV